MKFKPILSMVDDLTLLFQFVIIISCQIHQTIDAFDKPSRVGLFPFHIAYDGLE